jgi:hypothetical protein
MSDGWPNKNVHINSTDVSKNYINYLDFQEIRCNLVPNAFSFPGHFVLWRAALSCARYKLRDSAVFPMGIEMMNDRKE